MRTIIDRLDAGATAHPGRRLYAFLDGGGLEKDGYTYSAFAERTRGLARHLQIEGKLRRGDRVLLVYPPGLELVVALVACARIGVIAVPIHPESPSRLASGSAKLPFVARDCGAGAVLTTLALLQARRTVAAVDDAPAWIATDDVRGPVPGGLVEDPDPVLLLQYTSGSTGAPKGVVVSHENVLHNCAGTLDFVPTCVSWLPQQHDMGLIGYYLYPLITGGTTFGFAPVDFLRKPLLWLETITRVRATHSGAPNFGYDYCLREDKVPSDAIPDLDLSCLRVMMNASEPVRPATRRRFLQKFSACGLSDDALVAAYGLAENTITVTQHGRRSVAVNRRLLLRNVLHVERPRDGNANQLEVMSCGRPIDGVEVSVVDTKSRRVVGEERIGEIWTAGKSTCGGYWNRPALSADVFGASSADAGARSQRFLRTGDLGFLHDGELYVCGRMKDLVIVRGVNHHPHDIEAIVEGSCGGIKTGGIAAFQGEGEDDGLVVLIEAVKPKDLPDAAAIARAIRARCLLEPRTIAFVARGALPKTTSGKLARWQARRRWLRGELPVLATYDPSRDRPPSAGASGARRRFRYVLEAHDLTGDEDVTLAEVGIDSLTTVELLADIKGFFEERGAASLGDALDAGLLDRLTVGELFETIDRLADAPQWALARFRARLRAVSEELRSDDRRRMRADAELPVAPFCVPRSDDAPVTDLLMTGTTGFFGPFLLSSLLRQTRWTIHVLTRAAGPEHGMERIRAGLLRAGLLGPIEAEALLGRVKVVCGDLARPELGCGGAAWNALANGVQAVLHNGALVNYVSGYESLRPHNVEGTRELIRLAATGIPKTFHFVSSTFIFGWTAKELLRESDDNAAMENLDFGYAQSKWVAEQLVHASGRRGLDVRVYRPSLISAASNGVGSRDDVAVRLLAFMIASGLAPDARNQLSFLPADVAAHNIAAIVAGGGWPGATLHVTVERHYTMVDLARQITRAYGHPFVYLPIPGFVAEMNRRATKSDPIYPLLDFFNRSHEKIAAMQHKRYDNEGYRAARDRTGVGRADPTLGDTVDYLMAFLLKEGLIPRADHAASKNPA